MYPSSPTSPTASGGAMPVRGTSASCPAGQVHCKLQVKEITFSGNIKVEKDTLRDFPAPEWKTGRPQAGPTSGANKDKENSPVCYVRNTKVSLASVVFEVVQHPSCTEDVWIVGKGVFGAATLQWGTTVSVSPGDATVTLTGLDSDVELPDAVACFDTASIAWQANPASTGFADAGTSAHVMYVVLGAPSGFAAFWTPLDISCRAAAGTNKEDDFIKACYTPFSSKLGDGNGFKRKRDNQELSYWKLGLNTPQVFTCPDLLASSDGIGRCGAWRNFLLAIHHIHGIASSWELNVFSQVRGDKFLVKNVNFVDPPSHGGAYPYVGQSECKKVDGAKGQGKNNPTFTFGDHALLGHTTGIYDPSYGTGPFMKYRAWEDAALDGLGNSTFKTFTYTDGTFLHLPDFCGKGFGLYMATSKESLDSVAKKSGVGSGAALYQHAINNAYRQNHALADDIQPGEFILIPRELSGTVLTVTFTPQTPQFL